MIKYANIVRSYTKYKNNKTKNKMLEQIQTSPLRHEDVAGVDPEQVPGEVRKLSGLALDQEFEGVVKGFYNADGATVRKFDAHILPSGQLQKAPDNAQSYLSVGSQGEEIYVATGQTAEELKQATLAKMRTLESLRTKPLAEIPVQGDASVSFTSIDHYAPKMAPSIEAYPIPSYLEDKISEKKVKDLYEVTHGPTIETEGWQQETFDIVADYLQTSESGQKMIESLGIRSLKSLTPEQAVKLSVWFVQDVSKYSHHETSQPQGEKTPSDQATTMKLLRDGIKNKDNPNWDGNGVCRNVASNVKTVFDALKDQQGEHSMLTNTYAVRSRGSQGDGYHAVRGTSRNAHLTTSLKDRIGHAWNEFITIDVNGSSNITIIDATWGMETPDHLQDYTAERSGREIVEFFDKAEDKKEAFYSAAHYFEGVMKGNLKKTGEEREQARDYALTEYLKIAKGALPAFQDVAEQMHIDPYVFNASYRIGEDLTEVEVDTLAELQKMHGDQEVQGLFAKIVKKHIDAVHGDSAIAHASVIERSFIKADPEYQAMVFDALGEEAVVQYAEHSGKLRAKLREIRPEVLPPFDPDVFQADARELATLISWDRISHFEKPELMVQKMHREVQKLAGNEQIYNAVVAGRSDYDLAKNFTAIRQSLKRAQKDSQAVAP